ncbi:MAG: YecA family protein [Burkholderiales bacterium]|nr:YecA family protein [Burkholderiales bacterium]
MAPPHAHPAPRPLSEAELEHLQSLLDQLPPGHEALDVVMLDGYLCGVLLQPRPVPQAQWLKHVVDIDGRPAPAGYPLDALHALVLRRHAELNRAIERREWFDPWVYQLDAAASPSETVLPWVAGFATAMDLFPALMARHESALLEPLATLYRHFDPEDLEDADELLAEIETLELPESLPEAVEDLVRIVLLMADVSRPRVAAPPGAGPRRGPPPRRAKPAPRR